MRWFLALAIFCLPLAAAANEEFRVTAQFTRLGQVIARPQMEVENGETLRGYHNNPGVSQYTIAFKVVRNSPSLLSVTFQFTSGSIDVTSQLNVEPGVMGNTVVDNQIVVDLLVEPILD